MYSQVFRRPILLSKAFATQEQVKFLDNSEQTALYYAVTKNDTELAEARNHLELLTGCLLRD